MADNSKAEQIMQALVTKLGTIDSLATVTRRLPTLDEIKRTSITQMPKVAAAHDLPKPQKVERFGPVKLRATSLLPVILYLYFQSPEASKTAISLTDDIWAALCTDRRLGGLALDMKIVPESIGDFSSVVACKIRINIEYQHDHSSI